MPFKKGESGNPSGRPPGSSDRRRLVTELLVPEAPALVGKAIELALAGDQAMLKACLDKLIPNSRHSRTVSLAPGGAEGVELHESVVQAATTGEMSLEEARGLMELCALKARIDEATELRERIESLEKCYEQVT